jgi:hypothetical protein
MADVVPNTESGVGAQDADHPVPHTQPFAPAVALNEPGGGIKPAMVANEPEGAEPASQPIAPAITI